jgi:hypothetical protein
MNNQKMTAQEVLESLKGLSPGDWLHVMYEAFGVPTTQAIAESAPAMELNLPKGHYTGEFVRAWNDSKGDLIVTMLVKLERDNKYRAFNVDRGRVIKIKTMK